ncbi:helix-turn-helix domain-containing protein [Aeromicrobium sp.]|uniref:PucR family transcriptional regulator n=1 Tax=Aeromicrobium sp. TaxID=1871063 RepID=UPI0028A85E60|nr:helix-turn-helix domain-containing protein [Aeromicrobium sp.]
MNDTHLGGGPDTTEVRQLVATLGQRLSEQQPILTRVLTDKIRSISDLDLDQPLIDLLDASVDSNINTIVHLLINAIPVDRIQAPTAAVEYALRLAQRGVPSYSLVRAYQMGQEYLMTVVLDEAEQIDADRTLTLRALKVIADDVHQYIDWICLHLLDRYEDERGRWATTSGNVASAMLQGLLRGVNTSVPDFEAETGYLFDQHHVGLVLWSRDEDGITDALVAMERISRELEATVGTGTPPLFSAIDRTTAWLWIGRGLRPESIGRQVCDVLAKFPEIGAAVGLPESGIDGFRRTHAQARDTFELALAATDRIDQVVGYGDRGIALISMLLQQPGALNRWVRDVLGPLGAVTPAAARARETLGTWLENDRSFQATAEALQVHRNTVKYRIERIAADLDERLGERRVDLELALLACHLLGDDLLEHPDASRRPGQR